MAKNFLKYGLAGAALMVGMGATQASAGLIVSTNGQVQLGINNGGELDNSGTSAGFVGLGYNFTGQGGRTGFNDALTPGCPCEAWGVAGNGVGGQIGQSSGVDNMTTFAPTDDVDGVSFTTHSALTSLPGLTVTQAYTRSVETRTGALFQDTVTIHNGTGAAVTDLRYTRAMDWDVPPSEFSEFTTFVGTGTTTSLLRSTDNGFASANPMSAVFDGGIVGPINADGTTGPADHGSLFTFGFGDLADGADYTFNIFYGAGLDEADALTLLSMISPELYTLGQSNVGGRRADFPTFIFAFNGVGGSVVVPPRTGVAEPAGLGILGLGLAGMIAARRRKA